MHSTKRHTPIHLLFNNLAHTVQLTDSLTELPMMAAGQGSWLTVLSFKWLMELTNETESKTS